MVSRLKRASRLYRQRLFVETYLGETGVGQSFADPAPVMGLISRQVRVVKNPQGVEVTAIATVYCDPVKEALFAPESRVTLPGDTRGDVITAAAHPDHRGRDTVLEVTVG